MDIADSITWADALVDTRAAVPAGVPAGRAVFEKVKELKHDAFGCIEQGLFYSAGVPVSAIRRLYTSNLFLRPVAKVLAHNEKTALKKLQGLTENEQIPRLLYATKDFHVRSFLDADVLYRTEELGPEYFQQAKLLLRAMRRLGVCNNDTAKAANWLVLRGKNMPALVDFQLALCFPDRRNIFFRMCCREDLRHLLKQKRKRFAVGARERAILSKKSVVARLWMSSGKRVYVFVTRKILGWQDRTGDEERDI